MDVKQNFKVIKFIQSLQETTIAKVIKTIGLLETFGSILTMPHSKEIGPRLFELRVRGQQEVRIFYTFHKNAAYLLHGFIKKELKIPKREIKLAIEELNRLI